MEKLVNLSDLLNEEASELYDAEQQQLVELPRLRDKATSPELKNALDKEIEETKIQTDRLDKVFDNLDYDPEVEQSECCKTIFNKTHRLIDRSADPQIRDAGIISSLQHLNHYKMASYGSTATYARELKNEVVSKLLHESLGGEQKTDNEFSDLAEKHINVDAISPVIP